MLSHTDMVGHTMAGDHLVDKYCVEIHKPRARLDGIGPAITNI